MKQAVIVVGSHFAGKSKTINAYLKPKLGISEKAHIFTLKGNDGFILSQSFEEADRDVDYVINKYCSYYHYLVLAARPKEENPSSLEEALVKLSKAGFNVHTVIVNGENAENYYDSKAQEIVSYLNG